jgi:hypothetical protein
MVGYKKFYFVALGLNLNFQQYLFIGFSTLLLVLELKLILGFRFPFKV